MRSEKEIFLDLETLCSSKGYIHALSYLCYRDNIFAIGDTLDAADLQNLHSEERLIRTEISLLIGLMLKKLVGFELPSPTIIQEYIKQSESLLGEMHDAMIGSWATGVSTESPSPDTPNPFSSGESLREPIFYSAELAYTFQYLDFAQQKYAADSKWLKLNKGFDIAEVALFVSALHQVQTTRLLSTLKAMKTIPLHKWTILPGFVFTIRDIVQNSTLTEQVVSSIVAAFSQPNEASNANFDSIHAYSVHTGSPIITGQMGEFILLQYYSIVEAMYDSPFYWMATDREYKSKAFQHRGIFAEAFAEKRLCNVFGRDRVYANVDVNPSKQWPSGEIDVLVIFGNRAIILQAKSKRLTIEARKGNDGYVKDDFKKAVQDAYDQGFSCAHALLDPACRLQSKDGKPIKLSYSTKYIHIICVVSDHYPSLNFQARQFLAIQENDRISYPITTDIFALDAIVEMLETPVHFINYLDLRRRFAPNLMASHEMVLLSFHLRQNLWIEKDIDMLMLSDDVSVDLDVAMVVRRCGLSGVRTPVGILTKLNGTVIGQLISSVEDRSEPGFIDLALFLLQLNENTLGLINSYAVRCAAMTGQDGKVHDFTVAIGMASSGLTIHTNPSNNIPAIRQLTTHCAARKYAQRAENWFGILLSPADCALQTCVQLNYPWEHDEHMDGLVATSLLQAPSVLPGSSLKTIVKPGRNAPCSCGSGRKYKKYCGLHL